MTSLAKDFTKGSMSEYPAESVRQWPRNAWKCSRRTIAATLLGLGTLLLMAHSFLNKQLDNKGCEMSYMRPIYHRMDEFDTKHTRFASKYKLYLYREGGIDSDRSVNGVPVMFIPGNAGSYKQVRSYASEAAYHYHNTVRHEREGHRMAFDFFSVDFNEDITAFHGQTLLDQAEYMNDAISFILSLYYAQTRYWPSEFREPSELPKPASVIIVGHSMGGVVARTMLTMPNYQSQSINTIVTLAAPHARPPVSFDGDIVRLYKGVNDYWQNAYSQKLADNSLRDVTLISIAGGGLDTMISSEYADISSLVPQSHGFTVFTSSMKNVWTGADHLAITWCDQVRKSVVHALYDVVDVGEPSQTIHHKGRVPIFKKWFLMGLEGEKPRPYIEKPGPTSVTVEEKGNIVPEGQQLVLRSMGHPEPRPKVYLMPVPRNLTSSQTFTLLTNEKLDHQHENDRLDVLLCVPPHIGLSGTPGYNHHRLAGDSSEHTDLDCTSAAPDVISLPASTRHSKFPSKKDEKPLSYLEYAANDMSAYTYVVIIDKINDHSHGWLIAEFRDAVESTQHVDVGLGRMSLTDLHLRLPYKRSLMTEIRVPALQSSLLAYNLFVGSQHCLEGQIFTPLVRQYITNMYESKFFVNTKDADINLYGVAPYIPPAYFAEQPSNGLALQIWSDPTCEYDLDIVLGIDGVGSLGKLWMRYRIALVVFPVLVVALVLRHQFQVYDDSGIFLSFAESLNECVRGSLPTTFAALTLVSVFYLGSAPQWQPLSDAAEGSNLFGNTDHELLLGTQDRFFWFLVPLLGIMSVAICVVVNYVALVLVSLFALLRSFFPQPTNFTTVSTTQRIFTACILLSLISTVVPYHLAYAVLCLIQLATCVRSLRLAQETPQSEPNTNFNNYTHTVFILMLWILPINVPVLVVWVRNLTVGWLTPFSPHHNILSILPFVLLVETLGTGRMVPRLQSRFRAITTAVLFGIAAFAAMYGVTYAYVLHHLANALCAWLVALHVDASAFGVKNVGSILGLRDADSDVKKRP